MRRKIGRPGRSKPCKCARTELRNSGARHLNSYAGITAIPFKTTDDPNPQAAFGEVTAQLRLAIRKVGVGLLGKRRGQYYGTAE
jgi:hypothetical protein